MSGSEVGNAEWSSSVSSSVELHSEKALCIGGRIGGMLIILGGSIARCMSLVGDCGVAPCRADRSGHDFGDRGEWSAL